MLKKEGSGKQQHAPAIAAAATRATCRSSHARRGSAPQSPNCLDALVQPALLTANSHCCWVAPQTALVPARAALHRTSPTAEPLAASSASSTMLRGALLPAACALLAILAAVQAETGALGAAKELVSWGRELRWRRHRRHCLVSQSQPPDAVTPTPSVQASPGRTLAAATSNVLPIPGRYQYTQASGWGSRLLAEQAAIGRHSTRPPPAASSSLSPCCSATATAAR